MDIITILKNKYPADIAENVVNSYLNVEQNFAAGRWKTSELDAGHFVESVRRLLEYELTGTYTPFSAKITEFNNSVIDQYERAVGKDDSFRFHIPRILKAIYGVRSKRGVGHIASINPNKMDSTLILYTCKWVLAELVRLASGLSLQETQKAIDNIVTRQIEVVWKDGSIVRILAHSMKTKEQILVLLYDSSPQIDSSLCETIEYSNLSRFKTILKELHGQRFLEYKGGMCYLSPKGTIEAEGILKRFNV